MLREVYSLGQGVAFRIDSPELLAIRARIADHFAGMLTAQDQGTPRLHITVQNKVAAAEARALLAELARSEEHTSELQSLMRISYAVFCLKKKKKHIIKQYSSQTNMSKKKKNTKYKLYKQ